MGHSSTGGMWGSPKHSDPSSPQPRGCTWLCDGCGVGPSPTPSLRSVPGHAAPSPSKDNEEWQKNESNNKSRPGPPCCQHLNWGREQPVPPFQLGTVGWGRNGERKQNPKQQLSNNCFLQYVQSPAGRASPYSGPRGRVRHGHTQPRPMAPMSPGWAAGEAGAAGAARPLRGRGRVSAWGERAALGRGAEDQKAPVLGAGEQPGVGTIFLQDLVPPALARGWSGDQHGPTCLWQNLSVLVPHCALPAAWGSRPKSKRWMKRGATAPHSRMCCPRVWGALAMVVGQRKGWDLQSCSSETKAKATGRSGPCTAWGALAACALLPPAPQSPSPHGQRLLCQNQELPQPHSGHRPCVGRSGTELWVLWGAGPEKGLGEPHSCLQPGCHPPAQLAPAPRHLPRLREPVLASFPETVATRQAQPRVPSPRLPPVLS